MMIKILDLYFPHAVRVKRCDLLSLYEMETLLIRRFEQQAAACGCASSESLCWRGNTGEASPVLGTVKKSVLLVAEVQPPGTADLHWALQPVAEVVKEQKCPQSFCCFSV